jgi:hypothetical protein
VSRVAKGKLRASKKLRHDRAARDDAEISPSPPDDEIESAMVRKHTEEIAQMQADLAVKGQGAVERATACTQLRQQPVGYS